MKKGKGLQRRIDLPPDWWDKLVDFCQGKLVTKIDADIYRLTKISRKTFSDAKNNTNKNKNTLTEAMIDTLAHSVCKTRTELLSILGKTATPTPASTAAKPDPVEGRIPVPAEVPNFQHSMGRLVSSLQELESLAKTRSAGQSRDALEEIEAWATNDSAPPFCALLGEYGMGKTTTLRQFTRHLLDKRQNDPNVPLPIYVDLRSYVRGRNDSVPTIEEILNTIFERSWKLSDQRAIKADDILRLVRQEGAVILFDGLDEQIVHLAPDRARDFIRTLWAVLPDAARSDAPEERPRRGGKLLISCRSHYFRDVWSQNAMLTGEGREAIHRGRYPAFCLLPFTEEQIRGFLTSFTGSSERATEVFNVLNSVYNLRELAERPYLLSLITEHVGDIEALATRGETVNTARLYDLVVRSWLNRDDGKHQIEPPHKRRLMEELAASLWRDGVNQWDVDRLEDWLDHYLLNNPALERAYQNRERAILKEDLRTATFVLRPDTEEKQFRFAHTSLQEFFLAGYLVRALRESRSDRWDLPVVSVETLDFVGQILKLEPSRRSMQTLNGLLGGDCLDAAVIAFRYWLRAIEQEMPEPDPKSVNLSGANLEEWTIRGHGPDRLLPLRRANFSGVRLSRARLENVDLSGACLDEFEARQALFMDVFASKATASAADFCGLQWRKGSLAGVKLVNAKVTGCHWIGVDLTGAALPHGWEREAAASPPRQPVVNVNSAELFTPSGHTGSVYSCAWSPDGEQLVSGSFDESLKVWDARSGQCLLTLSGHTSTVYACAWSPDGERLVSGSGDNAVKVWRAGSVQRRVTLSGHTDRESVCAWSPDGERLVSGSFDNALKVWDARSGRCLLTLSGHGDRVNACAWSPDGERLVSGSGDNAVKVWDARSGQCLLTLSGHRDGVSACAWSPHGERLVSGSWDDSLKVWDARTGDCLLTLPGRTDVVRIFAWSPDGERLAGSSGYSLKVWDVHTSDCLLTLSGHTSFIGACAWSPDGERLVSGSWDNALKVWDARTGDCLLTISYPVSGHVDWVITCAWSPDGERLVSDSVSDDHGLKVWDTRSGQCLLTLSGHTGRVFACAWSPDGERLVTASSDGLLEVWDTRSGQCLLTLSADNGQVLARM